MVAGSARVEWLDADEAEHVEIEPVDEHVDRTHRSVLSHVVVEQRREQRALPAIDPLHEPSHQSPPADSLKNHSSRAEVFTRPGPDSDMEAGWEAAPSSSRGDRYPA